ncbi:hypothetical protein MLD38_040758 [Melastoma candidum]|nr:hypothetical protein MLD38_040758 [Melastoma candidum]
MKGSCNNSSASVPVGEEEAAAGSTTTSTWSAFFSVFDPSGHPSGRHPSGHPTRLNASWSAAVKKVVAGVSMRRIHERVLGSSRTGVPSPTADIWLLGVCYRLLNPSSHDVDESPGLAAFHLDFSSRILFTYRKGFEAFEDSGYTSDVNWGCMLRSSQMLVAQALLFHKMGRSWRKLPGKPLDQEYVQILTLFGDSSTCPFSIHNLIRAGKAYDLAIGSWVGPYAVCRSWENLFRTFRAVNPEEAIIPMAVIVVSGDEDGERGGAPVLCMEDVKRHCLEVARSDVEWMPILLLVPLVLGLEKINPRYGPLLRATFSFPQSVGILGGKPGASTYIVGVQDENLLYLDPHDVQLVASISTENSEADTSSYHCNVIRHFPIDLLDSSLAIGFYCQDRNDFHDFCYRATKLADESDGAPLFTVVKAQSRTPRGATRGDNSFRGLPTGDGEDSAVEDDWQIL